MEAKPIIQLTKGIRKMIGEAIYIRFMIENKIR
jgi:hypothetical protein